MKTTRPTADKTKRLTLTDIATKANVSTATVSLALNGSPLVAAKTVRAINEIAQRLGYSPNGIARRLSTGRSEVISLLIFTDDASSDDWILPSSWMYYNPIIKGIYEVLMARKYHLQLEIVAPGAPEQLDMVRQQLSEKSSDGVIFLLIDEGDCAFAESMRQTGRPVVSVNHKFATGIPSIEIDNRRGAGDAVEYFAKLGHRRIAHIAGPDQSYNALERRLGYTEALRKAGIDAPPDYVRVGDWSIESGYRGMAELLALKKRPTAVFCANDHMAIGALDAIKDQGLEVPKDISLIGFDDSEIAKVSSPKLTTFQQPLKRMGQLAAEAVLEPAIKKKHVTLRPLLLERCSCAPPPKGRR